MNCPSPKSTNQIYSPNFIDFQASKGAQLTEELVPIHQHILFIIYLIVCGSSSANMIILQFDERMTSALSFVQKLQVDINTEYVRCPYLAPVEIERRRRLKGKDDDMMLEALLNYFHRLAFNDCIFCHEDIK